MELQIIENKIHEIRGQKVMLDFDLALMYETETRILNQSVKRNLSRFPADFMFQLTKDEWKALKSQFVISKTETRGGAQKLPYVFTEQGLAMLSGILNSDKAIEVNIAIMRTFVMMRKLALTNKSLSAKIKEMEEKYDQQFGDVIQAINYLIKKDKAEMEQPERKKIGF
jgi:ORF6N domain